MVLIGLYFLATLHSICVTTEEPVAGFFSFYLVMDDSNSERVYLGTHLKQQRDSILSHFAEQREATLLRLSKPELFQATGNYSPRSPRSSTISLSGSLSPALKRERSQSHTSNNTSHTISHHTASHTISHNPAFQTVSHHPSAQTVFHHPASSSSQS